MKLERIHIALCWIPLLVYGLTLLYVRQFDGWGSWAAAPLLLPPLALSALWGMGGIWLLWTRPGSQTLNIIIVGASLVGGAPALIVLVRALTS